MKGRWEGQGQAWISIKIVGFKVKIISDVPQVQRGTLSLFAPMTKSTVYFCELN